MKLYCPECQTRYEGEEYEICPEDGARLFRVDADADGGDPLIDAVIDGRFRIDDLLGAGGMGAVYRATQLSIQREVALKVLRSELGDEEVALERFYREAKVVSELSHPNIVRLVDFGQDRERDLLYLVMELVRGMDLGDLVERGRLRTNLALEVVYQVCGALTEPHQRGIVHRDMKPENVIIVPVSDGTLQVKVLDFGIARVLEDDATKLTKTGMICGTPWYMSPEQAQNHELDGRTDIYALGVILFEMLTGQPPFMGDTSLQVLLNHIQRPAPNLTEIAPAGMVPEAVSELVGEMMEKSPDARPATARQVRDRIDELRQQLGLRPVRLDVDRDDPFDAWLLPALQVEDGQWSAPPESGESLPEGLGLMETGEVEVARGRTDEFAGGAGGENSGSEGTERQYVGVADTMAADEPVQSDPPPGRKTQEVEKDKNEASPQPGPEDTDQQVLDRPAVPTEESTWREESEVGSSAGRTTSLFLLLGVVGMIAICSAGGVVMYLVASEMAEEDEEPRAEADEEPTADEDEADEEVREKARAEADSDEADGEMGEDDNGEASQEEDEPEEDPQVVAEASDAEEESGVGAPEREEGEREAPEEQRPAEPVVDDDPSPAEEEADEESVAAEESAPEEEEAAPAQEEPEEEPVDTTDESAEDEDSADADEEPEEIGDVEDDEPDEEERDELQQRLDGLR